MGMRFRKSFKIAPGVKFNVNKKSVGMTFGSKGVHYTVNSSGRRTTSVGAPVPDYIIRVFPVAAVPVLIVNRLHGLGR